MQCPHPHYYDILVAIGLAAHSITLLADYLLGKAKSIESNSLVELFIKFIASKFKKKPTEDQNGKQTK